MLPANIQPPPPLIGVSAELFTDKRQVSGYNWTIINSFRKYILPFGSFRFIFLHSDIARDYPVLVELGLRFTGHQSLINGNRASEESFVAMCNTMEFIYAPQLTTLAGISNALKLDYRTPEEIAEVLHLFIESGTPYTREYLDLLFKSI